HHIYNNILVVFIAAFHIGLLIFSNHYSLADASLPILDSSIVSSNALFTRSKCLCMAVCASIASRALIACKTALCSKMIFLVWPSAYNNTFLVSWIVSSIISDQLAINCINNLLCVALAMAR